MNVDLSQAQDWNKPRISAAQKAESIPSLYIETLFRGDPSSSKLYSVNGVYQQASSQAPYSYRKTALTDPKYRAPPDKYTQVYSYDTKTGVWALEKMGGDQVLRVSHGQGTNDGRGVSYYLDGSTGADQDSSITDGGYYYFPGLLEFDWRNMQIRNHTHTMTPQSRGFLQYVPLGSKGVLLAFGGRNFQPAVNKPTNTLKSMGEISVFDIDTKTWHKQIAVPGSSSNTLPPGRSSGCSVVMSAPDGTSHNIYMYSGSSVYYDGGKRYNDLWVLSLPSFTWTNIFTGTAVFLGSGL